MKRAMMLGLLVLCGGAIAQTPPPGPGMGRGGAMSVQNEQQARQQIQAALDAYQRAWNRHDAAGMASFFAEEGRVVNPFGERVEGRANIQKFFQREHEGFLKTTHAQMQLERVHLLTPMLAFADASIRLTGMRNPDGSAAPELKVQLSFVSVKRGETWKTLEGRAYPYLPPRAAAVGGAGEAGAAPEPGTTPPGPTPEPAPAPEQLPPAPGPTY